MTVALWKGALLHSAIATEILHGRDELDPVDLHLHQGSLIMHPCDACDTITYRWPRRCRAKAVLLAPLALLRGVAGVTFLLGVWFVITLALIGEHPTKPL